MIDANTLRFSGKVGGKFAAAPTTVLIDVAHWHSRSAKPEEYQNKVSTALGDHRHWEYHVVP